MPKLFLSYRREDSIDVAGRIYDRLAAHFGQESVFMDVDSIPLGVDFRAFFSDWISDCDVLLAVIGDGWLESRNADSKLRLGDPADFVTIEISAAMQREIPVIPVLVGRAVMPKVEELPQALSPFGYRNAAEVRSGSDFHSHMDRLIRGIEHHFKSQLAKRRIAQRRAAAEPRVARSAKAVYIVVEPPAVAKPTNLGFDGGVVDGMPSGWFNSRGFVSGVSQQYEVVVVPRNDGVAGGCVRMRRSNARQKEFGSLMQRCPAHNLVGKRIRVEAELRTEKLDSWAGVWVRIDSPSTHLFFDNMSNRPIRATTPWTNYAIETDVPNGSEWLNYGILLSSNGTLWADTFQVLVCDEQGEWNVI